MAEPIRVLIADDHEVVRTGLRTLLAKESAFECVGEARDGKEVVEKVDATQPHILLLDLRMPHFEHPASVVQALHQRYPELKVVVLTSFDTEEEILALLGVGVAGYLLKGEPNDRIREALQRVASGLPYYSPSVTTVLARQLMQPSSPPVIDLTPREQEVLGLLGLHLSNQEIAERLGIGKFTVRSHISRINSKLGFESRQQAERYAREHGYLPTDNLED